MHLKIIAFFLLFVKAQAFYAGNPGIVKLTDDNFDRLVKNSKEIWLVEFFAPWCGHCQSFVSEYEKTAKVLDGIIKVGAVDGDENAALLKEYNVKGFPTIKIFNGEKGAISDYEGQRKTSELVNFMIEIIKKKVNWRLSGKLDEAVFKAKRVKELSDRNFDDTVLAANEAWLVVFYSPFCDLSRRLAEEWPEIISRVQEIIKLGIVDGIFHASKTKETYKVNGYPTILFFPMGRKQASSAIQYSGSLAANAIIEWCIVQVGKTSPPVDLVEITSLKALKSACEFKPLCVLSFLPHILECGANCRNEYLNTLRNVSALYKQWLWGWVWCEAHSQSEIEEALEIGEAGYPAMAVVSINKMRYSVFVGAFSFNGLNEFLKGISYGIGNTRALTRTEMPQVLNLDPWDGKDIPDEELKFTTSESTILDDIDEILKEDKLSTDEAFRDEL